MDPNLDGFVSGIISFEMLLKIPTALICTGAGERKAPTESKISSKLYLQVLTTVGETSWSNWAVAVFISFPFPCLAGKG